MKKRSGYFSILLALILAFGIPVFAQDAKKENQDKDTFSIHVRELTDSERVIRGRTTELRTVLDAVASLKPLPDGLSKMDLWIARTGKAGKTQLLAIDWAGITREGQARTNFQILPGDRLFIQARFPK
jgi:hypothetical protein